ncbi:MAG: hypothetical protein ACTHK8_12935, partial [Ginsengibacter sp.]
MYVNLKRVVRLRLSKPGLEDVPFVFLYVFAAWWFKKGAEAISPLERQPFSLPVIAMRFIKASR